MSITWSHHQFKLLIFLAVTPMKCHVIGGRRIYCLCAHEESFNISKSDA